MKKKKIVKLMLVVAMILTFVSFSAEARIKQPPGKLAKPLINPTDAKYLTINSLKMPIRNDAVFAQNPYIARAGTEWPQGTENMYLYGAGIWIGAQIPDGGGGLKKVVSYGYNPNDSYSEWGPGIIISPYNADHGVAGSPPTYPILLSTEADSIWSHQDSLNWPFKDTLGNLKFVSAEDSWCFYNDADSLYHDPFASPGDQLNVFVKQTTYSFSSRLDKDIIFVVWDIFNQGDHALDSVYIGITVDPDLGNATDDMIGFDAARNLCWVYNYNKLFDQDIHGVPGMMGCRFFESPRDSAGDQLGLTSLTLFILATDPSNDEQRYNLMAARTTDGIPRPDTFMVDTSPEDKRFCQATGPFNMNVGDSVRVVFGVVAGQNENLLKVNSDYAQSLYNANFVAPIPPIPPVVQAIPGDRKVTLIWGDTSESSYEPFAEKDTALIKYDFEGYRIYRSRTGVEGDFEVLAEYDLKDGITNDNEDDVDPVYGTPIVVTVHLGEDTGLKRYYVDSVNVLNGETYYYSVVAYDYQPKKPKSFESGKRASMVQVVPGTNAAGYIAPIAPDTATHTSSSFLSDGYALVTVVDPALVTGDDYQITFNTDLTWNLIDVTTGDTLLANQENQSGDYDYPFVDGIQVRVAGPSIGFNEIDLVSDSLSFLFYEAYMGGRNALNNNDFRIFKIKFVAGPGDTTAAGVYQDSLGNNPWGYFRQDPTPVSVPFEIWDLYITLTDTTDDVRIWPLMYDLYDGRFHTDDYIMFLDKNNEGNKYSEDFWSNPDHDPSNSAYWGFNTADPMSRYDWDYRFAFSQANPVWAKGDYAIMVTFKPNTPNDVFSFSTRAAYISASQAKTDMDKIKVVPNPYFVRNELDRDPNVAHLMLTHLPEVCTIRLYTLAGNLIQKIEHTSGTGQEIWNALTRNDQIPASGVYIYHISSEFGEKVGRFAVIR